MKRAIIVHGWGGYPEEGWFPNFKKELESRGYKVSVPKMPHPENPTIGDWVKFLSKIVGEPNGNTYLVGHSIGCQTILRYLESLNVAEKTVNENGEELPKKKIAGALFVAGWFNLENLEDDDERRIAEPWLTTWIDLKKVGVSLPKSTLIISDNDPYGSFEYNKKKFSELGSKIVVLHNAEHINGESHTSLPETLFELESL